MSGMDAPERRGARLVEAWRTEGDFDVVGGHELFVVDRGPAEAPVIVLLHGFPGSSFDWRHVLAALSARWRVVAFDFLGFGLSAKPFDDAYSLFDQADLATEVLLARGVRRATLVAHDMGDTVAAELLVRANEGPLRRRVGRLHPDQRVDLHRHGAAHAGAARAAGDARRAARRVPRLRRPAPRAAGLVPGGPAGARRAGRDGAADHAPRGRPVAARG